MRINTSLVQDEIDDFIGKNVISVYNDLSENLIYKNLPEEWLRILSSSSTNKKNQFIKKWRNTKNFNKFSSILKDKLHEIYLGYDNLEKKFILLYILIYRNEIIIFIGNQPSERESEKKTILKKIDSIHSIHDGYYLMRGGINHLYSQNEILAQIKKTEPDNFIKIFQDNVDWLGFGLNNGEYIPYIIWSDDEEIEEVDNIYEEIDEWLALTILEYDDVDN